MQNLTNKKLFLFYTDKNKESKTGILIEKLQDKYSDNLVSEANKADIIICVWGDGNFFKAASEFYKLDKYILPIWTGTINFLLNKINSLDELDNDFKLFEFSLIEGEVEFNSWEVKTYSAFNDFYLNADYWKMWNLTIRWETYPEREISWDGVIVATPAGSTGYNINAGWVVIPLLDNIWSITDINSRLSLSHVIEAQNLEIIVNRRGFVGHFDNNQISDFKKVKLSPCSHKIKMLYTLDNDFENLRYKLKIF